MSPILVVVTVAALGVEVGWEPLADGGHEYTIQIEPQLWSLLESGSEEIVSDVPPELDVRRYRIRVGTGPLARDARQPAAAPPREPAPPVDNDVDSLPPAGEHDPGAVPPVEDVGSDRAAAPTPAIPDEPLRPDPFDEPPSPSDLGPENGNQFGATGDRRPSDVQPPGKLPPDDSSGPVEPARFEANQPGGPQAAAPIETQKPQLPDVTDRPWTVLVASVVLLCCSLGANIYLGWIAWGARSRYREAVSKLRTAS